MEVRLDFHNESVKTIYQNTIIPSHLVPDDDERFPSVPARPRIRAATVVDKEYDSGTSSSSLSGMCAIPQ